MRKPALPAAVIRRELRRRGIHTEDLVPLAEGEESQAFRLQSFGVPYVVRLNATSEGFAKDALAYRKFARPDLPIPEIVSIWPAEGCFFCVSRALPGVTLQDLLADQLPAVLRPAAMAWEAIARSDLGGLSGFGLFNSEGIGKFQSWRDFLISIADSAHYDWASVSTFVGRDTIAPLLDELLRLVPQYAEVRGLVHGDFGSNNVLADGRRITGVLDWSEAAIGDPLYDVANVLFWRTWLPCMEAQAHYFESKREDVTALRKRLVCYQLRIGLSEIWASASKGDGRVLRWAIARCRALADC